MEKEKFLNYCVMFRDDLKDLQENIDTEYTCTLAYLGANYSYELANIGFELGYANWYFSKGNNFNEIKNDFLCMIMENEKIIGAYDDKELAKIEKRILECKEKEGAIYE